MLWRSHAARFVRLTLTLLLASGSQLGLPAGVAAAESRNVRLQAGAGYGVQDDDDAGSYGAALGIKAGVTVVDWLHLGVQGTFHWGSRFGEEQNRVQYYRAEAGARLASDWAGVTPYLTFGVALIETQRNVDPSLTTGYLGLGVAADVAIDLLLFGADIRAVTMPGGVSQGDNLGPSATIDFLLTAGVRL